MKKLEILGLALTGAGAILTIAQQLVSDKQQKETIHEEVLKVLSEQALNKE